MFFRKKNFAWEYSKILISSVNVSLGRIILQLLLIRTCFSFSWQWNRIEALRGDREAELTLEFISSVTPYCIDSVLMP